MRLTAPVCTAHVIEVENQDVALAAIDARMLR